MRSGGRRRNQSQPQAPGLGDVDLNTEPGSEAGARRGASERFGSGGRKKIALLYIALIVTIILVLQFLLNVGRGLQAPPPEESGGGAVGGSAEDVLWRLLLASVVIIVAARVVGAGMRKINQPQVVGEIIAGILLGPSALGALWPRATEVLFPSEIMPFLDLLANVGLILFMFLVGLELDFGLIRGRGQAAVWVSGASIAAPFLSGVALALLLFPLLGSSEGRFTSFGLFIGASMSITAFPVLARILTERGLYKTKLGAVTLTCAAVDDVTAWCMLAVVVTVARATGAVGALATIALSLAFIVAMIYFVRPLMQRLARYHEERGRLSAGVLAALFVGIILSALITDRIGIHVIFGAFLFGAVMPHRPAFVREITEKVEDFAVLFLLPIFFAFSGLRTELGRIGSVELWLLTVVVLLVAIAGKWGGSTLAARVAGLEWRESSALGVLMNCRGLTELIILNIGLQLGVLPSTLFAMLVIMAVVTTVMTEPLLALHYPRDLQRRLIAEQAEATGEAAEVSLPRRRILVPVVNPHTAGELARVATMLAGDPASEQIQITLLRVVEPPGRGYTMAPFVQESLVEQAAESLRPLVDQIEQAGVGAVPLVVASSSVGDTIARVANERDVDLVLVGYHRAMFGDRLLGGTVSDVLRDAETDVAVLVVPADRRNVAALPDGARILVPYGGGFHEDAGLDLALRLGTSTNGELTLIGPTSPEGESELAEQAANAYERSGVWTKSLPVEGDVAEAVARRARNVDFLVMGVSDRWADDQSIGDVRQELVERAASPFLLVRRHGRRRSALRRWFARLIRRPQEWMEQLTEDKHRSRDGSG